MKVTTTIQLDCGKEVSKIVYETPDPNEEPRPDEDDGSVGTGDKEDEEGDVKPFN